MVAFIFALAFPTTFILINHPKCDFLGCDYFTLKLLHPD